MKNLSASVIKVISLPEDGDEKAIVVWKNRQNTNKNRTITPII